MDCRQVILFSLLAVGGLSHAGYAQLSPPVGWSAGTSGVHSYGPPANEKWLQSTVRTNASLNVGGRAITVPVSMRLAANANQFLASRIATGIVAGGSGMLTGGLSIAAALALPSVIDWYKQTNYEWDPMNWFSKKLVYNGNWRGSWQNAGEPGYDSVDQACRAYYGTDPLYGSMMVNSTSGSCTFNGVPIAQVGFSGTTVVEKSLVDFSPLVQNALGAVPLPAQVPNVIWPLSWPVDAPKINPNPAGEPQPLFVPTGNPVPNPNYDPNAAPGPNNHPYIQPGVRIVPAPTPAEPWRVDVQPTNRPVDNPNPMPGPDTEPNPDDKPKPEEDQGLCEKYPDILACQKVELGDLNPEPLPKNTVPLTINREEGFGPSNGACPAAKQFVIMGKPMAFRWDLLCDFASQIRPLLVGFAYLSAALAFMGLSRKD